MSDIAAALIRSAERLGADPLDLGTVISYETAGRFSPSIRGGAGRRHIGLIQFGPEEQRRYGARQGQSFDEQMEAVERYLIDRGYRPGMGIADLYSTINAGRPGRYHASDARNGGAPGTVLDKVRTQMAGHRAKAAALLEGRYTPQGGGRGDSYELASAGDYTVTPSVTGRDPLDDDDSFAAGLARFSEPTDDPRRLMLREVTKELLADLLPSEGLGHADALGGGAGEQEGTEVHPVPSPFGFGAA